jgi:hypothetical protein
MHFIEKNNLMTQFSQAARQCLERSGWDENYRADISEYQSLMEREGCPLPTVVIEFLSGFGNLRVHYPHHKVPSVEDVLHFDALKAASAPKGKYCEDLDHYVARIGERLVVIGEAARGYLLLMMSSTGKVYAAYDAFLAYVGDSGEDAIEAFCTGRDFVVIPSQS